MRCTHKSIMWLALSMLLVAPSGYANDVVGLRGTYSDFFVAVRGAVQEGTTVTGIKFYSNDATVFPQVFLAVDEVDRRLPIRGAVLRSVSAVRGQAGYVTVTFPPYVVETDQSLWAVVRFPDNEALASRGIGGGAGIGWREQSELKGERSIFTVDGAVNEFMPECFDISIITRSQGKATVESPTAMADPLPMSFEVRHRLSRSGAIFQFNLPESGIAILDIYDVSGRHVAQVENRYLSAGRHEAFWAGVSSSGGRLANGIYLYRARVGSEEAVGKVVLLR